MARSASRQSTALPPPRSVRLHSRRSSGSRGDAPDCARRAPGPAPLRRPRRAARRPALTPSAPPAALQPAAAAAPAGPALPTAARPGPAPARRPPRGLGGAGAGPPPLPNALPGPSRLPRPSASGWRRPQRAGGGPSSAAIRGTALAVPGPRALSAGRHRPRCRRPRGGRGRGPVAPRRWRAAASGAGCPLAGVRAPERAGSGDRAWPGGGRCRAWGVCHDAGAGWPSERYRRRRGRREGPVRGGRRTGGPAPGPQRAARVATR